jgi:transposase
MPRGRAYPPELIERGVRLALESGRPIAHVAADLEIHSETLRKRVRRAEADSGNRGDVLTSEEREEIKKLRREVFELRGANEILKSASVFFAKELDPDRTKRTRMWRSIVSASGSSRSAGPWACRRPPTTIASQVRDRLARSRTSGSWRESLRCTRRTTAPMATDGPGRLCSGLASRSRGAGCSG